MDQHLSRPDDSIWVSSDQRSFLVRWKQLNKRLMDHSVHPSTPPDDPQRRLGACLGGDSNAKAMKPAAWQKLKDSFPAWKRAEPV